VDSKQASRSGAPHDAFVLAAILLVAAAVRIYAWSRTAVMFNDGPVFLDMADAIGQGRFADVLAHPYHPLYPALIAVAGLPPMSLETAAVSVSILGGLLSIAALFYFAREAFGRDVACLAAVTAAFHPWHVDFTSDVMSEGLYAGFFMLAFAALARLVVRATLVNALVCGGAIGLAYLVRPEGVGLALVAVIVLAMQAIANPDRRGRLLVLSGALALMASLLILPFVFSVGEQTGEWALTKKKSVTAMIGVEKARVGQRSPVFTGDASLRLPELAIRADGQGARLPERNLGGVLESVVRVATTSLSAVRIELFPFLLWGAWVFRRRADSAWLGWTIALPIVLYGGVLVLLVWSEGYVSRRHALWPWLPVFALAAIGWREFVLRCAPERWRGARVVALALGLLLVLGWGPRDLRARRLDRAPVRAAAEWLGVQHASSGAVAAQKLRTAHYAGAAFVPLMPGLDGNLEHYLRGREARWVIIDADKLQDHHGLEAGIGDWLEPVHSVSAQGRRVLVLELTESRTAS